MTNPFEELTRRLADIEGVLVDIKDRPIPSTNTPAVEPISPDELCKRLDISKPTAWAWEKKGIIQGYHLGNRKYFIWQEITAALTTKGKARPA